MQFVHYSKIQPLNEALMRRFHSHPETKDVDYVVTEFIDGDHLALYADYENKEFKVATRNRFLTKDMSYSCADEMLMLHKDFLLRLSEKEKKPIIVYGKGIGGNYNGECKGVKINTVCEYTKYNEFIIHDIYVPTFGFIGIDALQTLAEKFALKTTPILYYGDYANACGFPENGLSAIPFMLAFDPNYDNEMKGIVIRPIWNLTSGKERIIMKKLNRKYIGKKQEAKKKPPTMTDTLVDIAAWIDTEGQTRKVLDTVIKAYGAYDYHDVGRVAGRYVSSVLEKVNYVKYGLLTKEQKKLVHKELNRIAEDKLLKLWRAGKAA